MAEDDSLLPPTGLDVCMGLWRARFRNKHFPLLWNTEVKCRVRKSLPNMGPKII